MRFKRSIDFKIAVIVIISAVCGFGIMFIGDFHDSLSCIAIGAFIVIMPCFIWNLLPSDFDYFVRVYEDLLIIEVNRDNHLRFERETFKIISKSRKHIIIYDEEERAKICYNKELLEFLQGIET